MPLAAARFNSCGCGDIIIDLETLIQKTIEKK
jgi:hypothetical protein